jgi:hypothetical protein
MAKTSPVFKPFKICSRFAEKFQFHLFNSLVLKMKLPGVISFLKLLPICPIPKGIFFLVVLWTFLKLTKIPCAVSGLK